MFTFNDIWLAPAHTYSVALSDSKRRYSKVFPSRENATQAMYKQCRKMGVYIVKVWDDHHEKTYICNDGSQFHINRN